MLGTDVLSTKGESWVMLVVVIKNTPHTYMDQKHGHFPFWSAISYHLIQAPEKKNSGQDGEAFGNLTQH